MKAIKGYPEYQANGLDDLVGDNSRKQDGNDDADRIIRLNDRRVGHADPFAVFLVAVYPNLERSRRRKAMMIKAMLLAVNFRFFRFSMKDGSSPLSDTPACFGKGMIIVKTAMTAQMTGNK